MDGKRDDAQGQQVKHGITQTVRWLVAGVRMFPPRDEFGDSS